ncbi:MAG: class I SAM-dependent rRNA methyltransferase [Desulfuromonadaceae bacterium]|nr:class I SAM-dependent rRNA methyltransferase [Desulfuromonadaceae bacterium]
MTAKGLKSCVVGAQTEQMLKLGHPWIIRDRYTDQWPVGAIGECTTLRGPDGTLLGYALRDDDRRIVARVIGWPQDGGAPHINEHWFYTRFEAAYKLRKGHIDPDFCDAYRLVNAEGDLLPGLTVDVYAGFVMVQLYSRIWEPYREPMLQALQRLMRPQGIYEKFRPRKTRALEEMGDKEYSSLLLGQSAPDLLQVKENGLLFEVDLKRGLHTGLFMDQRENRKNIMSFCAGRRVLNLFSFTGAFSVAAAAAGAVQVTSVDASALYQERAQHNFALNRLNPAKHEFIVGDCHKVLAQLTQKRRMFDLIIMDPPSFSTVGKNRFTTSGGTSNLVAAALSVLEEGGSLITSSNHQKIDLPEYLKELRRGALQVATPLRVVQTSGQGPDFPFLVTCPEGRYLKYVVAVKG